MIVCLLLPGTNATAASFDCSTPKSLAERTICGNTLLSKLDERDAVLYQKAVALDSVSSLAFRKESMARKLSCGSDMRCIAEVYEISSRFYFDIIEKGALLDNYGNSKLRVMEKSRDNTENAPPTPIRHEMTPKQAERKTGVLNLMLFAVGTVSFLVTWKIFKFFLSLHDAFDLSPFKYYCKKLGAACTVSIASMLAASSIFLIFVE